MHTPTPQPAEASLLPCLHCGYDLTGVTLDVCPECAAALTPEAYQTIERRTHLLHQGRAIIRRSLLILAIGVVVCLVGLPLMMLLHVADQLFDLNTLLEQMLAAGFALFCVIGFSLVSLLALVMLDVLHPTKDARRLISLLWLKHLWLLHTPWLMIPIFAILLGGIERIFHKPSAVLGVFTVLFFFAWFVLSLIAYTLWTRRRQRELTSLQLHDRLRFDLAIALGFLIFSASAFLGLIGGISATMAITRVIS